jgi:SAM-dependent methyltransferase
VSRVGDLHATLEWAVGEILACPQCQGDLAHAPTGLTCARCAHRYAVLDGIPALVAGDVAPEIDAEVSWYAPQESGRGRHLPDRHHFAHAAARAPIAEALRQAGCSDRSLILSVATGSGVEIPFIRQVSERIVAVDISLTALREFRRHWPYLAVQAQAVRLPFKDGRFDALVVSGLLHHLAGYTALHPYLREFIRVTRPGGSLIAVEPNSWYPVQWIIGPVNRIMQRIRPGWRGLVPHERPLSPRFLAGQFEASGLSAVNWFSTTFVHNRLPQPLSERIVAWESRYKARIPFRSLGWWVLVWGRKGTRAEMRVGNSP